MVFTLKSTEKIRLALAGRAKERRLALGLPIQAVALCMGRTYQCIYGMEAHGTDSLRVLQEWAAALDCSVQFLVFGADTTRGLLEQAARCIDARTGRRKDLVRRIREELKS